MSEERNNGISDPVVSDLYRETATDRAPASLNEAVLRNAAAHADKGYAHSMLWMRPLAYAATVVLSLAIVFQVVLPPKMDGDVAVESMSPPADAAEMDSNADFVDAPAAQVTNEDDPLKRLRDQEERETTKIEEFEVPAVASETTPEVGSVLQRVDTDAEGALEEVAVQGVPQTPPPTDRLEAAAESSAAGIRQAGDMAAMRSVQSSDNAPAASFAASVETTVCEPEDIAAPGTWAECIERLEEEGRTEEAHAERIMLLAAFPDFEWPAE